MATRLRTAAVLGEETAASAKKARAEKGFRFQGILKFLQSNFEESGSDSYREWMTQYMSATRCAVCHGKRLRPGSLAVKLGGLSIADFTGLSLVHARAAVDKILTQLTSRQKEIAARPLEEVAERLDFLLAVGLELSQSRSLRSHAFRRRSAAHPAGDADWFALARRVVCAR